MREYTALALYTRSRGYYFIPLLLHHRGLLNVCFLNKTIVILSFFLVHAFPDADTIKRNPRWNKTICYYD